MNVVCLNTPMANTKQTRRTAPATNVISIRLDGELQQSLDEAMSSTKLSRSDLARMSMERGLKVLMAQLNAPVAA